jgi:hypothetical protein
MKLNGADADNGAFLKVVARTVFIYLKHPIFM